METAQAVLRVLDVIDADEHAVIVCSPEAHERLRNSPTGAAATVAPFCAPPCFLHGFICLLNQEGTDVGPRNAQRQHKQRTQVNGDAAGRSPPPAKGLPGLRLELRERIAREVCRQLLQAVCVLVSARLRLTEVFLVDDVTKSLEALLAATGHSRTCADLNTLLSKLQIRVSWEAVKEEETSHSMSTGCQASGSEEDDDGGGDDADDNDADDDASSTSDILPYPDVDPTNMALHAARVAVVAEKLVGLPADASSETLAAFRASCSAELEAFLAACRNVHSFTSLNALIALSLHPFICPCYELPSATLSASFQPTAHLSSPSPPPRSSAE